MGMDTAMLSLILGDLALPRDLTTYISLVGIVSLLSFIQQMRCPLMSVLDSGICCQTVVVSLTQLWNHFIGMETKTFMSSVEQKSQSCVLEDKISLYFRNFSVVKTRNKWSTTSSTEFTHFSSSEQQVSRNRQMRYGIL